MLWRPGSAIREIAGSSPFAFAAATAWVAGVFYMLAVESLAVLTQSGRMSAANLTAGNAGIGTVWMALLPGALSRSLMIVLFVSLAYVPLVILIANVFERRDRYSMVFRDNFASTASCALSALAMSLLVALVPAVVISWQSMRLAPNSIFGYLVLLVLIPLPVFAAYMAITLRAVFGAGWLVASATTLVSFLSLLALPVVIQVFNFLCASPFLLLLLFLLLRDRIGGVFDAQKARQAFKQNLEAATLNPADSSAHYNLGLIYQQRADFDNAEASYKRAVEIDDRETDAHYQLGRIARERGRWTEAIGHFETVVRQNSSHSQHEIWREIAQTYLGARQCEDALRMLDRFLAERPSDAEGRYSRGQALACLGRSAEAEEEMRTCIESVRTAPAYKFRKEQRWLRLAEQFLREKRV